MVCKGRTRLRGAAFFGADCVADAALVDAREEGSDVFAVFAFDVFDFVCDVGGVVFICSVDCLTFFTLVGSEFCVCFIMAPFR